MQQRDGIPLWTGKWMGIAAASMVLAVLMALVACAKCGDGSDREELERLSTVVLRMAQKAQGLLLTREADPARPDELPGKVLAQDGDARGMRDCYQVRATVLRDGKNRPRVVMLLCTKDGGRALIERMDCLESARLGQHWQASPLPPCEITFRDPAVVCPSN